MTAKKKKIDKRKGVGEKKRKGNKEDETGANEQEGDVDDSDDDDEDEDDDEVDSKWVSQFRYKQNFWGRWLQIFSYPLVLTYFLGAQKNRLIETVLLSTHNIGFGWEIRKLSFCYTWK